MDKKDEEKTEESTATDAALSTDDGKVTVDLDEVETPEADAGTGASVDAGPEASTEAERMSNKRARGARYREMERRLEAQTNVLGAQTNRIMQLENTFRSMAQRGSGERPAPAAAGDNGADELESIYQEQEMIAMQANAGVQLPKELVERLSRRAKELDVAKHRIIAQRELRQALPAIQGAQQHPMRAMLEMKFPDVYANPRAREWAGAWCVQRVARGRRYDISMVEESLEQARKEFGMATRPTSATQRSRTSGPGGGSGGHGGDARVITLTPDQVEMAKVAYKHLPEKEAIRKWAATVGKKLAEEK